MKLYFVPKKTTYKKYFRGKIHSLNQSNLLLKKGNIGLQILESARLSVEQIESFRRAFRRIVRKKGTFFLLKKANLLLTAKPAEVRMGSGKGNPSLWVVKSYKNFILMEFKGIPLFKAILAIKKACIKLSVKTQLIFK